MIGCLAKGWRYGAAAFAIVASPLQSAFAKDIEWSVSPVMGLHQPNLGDLNKKAVKAPFIGTATIRGEPNTPQEAITYDIPLGFENELDPIGANANLGLEFQWKQDEKNYFLMGVSTWEGYTMGSTTVTLPVQGRLFDATYDRRIKMSYNEFYFGIKHIFKNVPNRYRFYGRVSVNELFDIDYREEHVFSIEDKGTTMDGVKRIFQISGQATGIAGLQFGAGGEYFIKKNFAVAGEFGYLLTEGAFEFTNASSREDSQGGDGLTLSLPVSRTARDVNSPLGHLPPDTDARRDWTDKTNNPIPSYSPMSVSFDGWKASLRVILYY